MFRQNPNPFMLRLLATLWLLLSLPSLPLPGQGTAVPIPLPEHPRPDFERPRWLNLNGDWAFRFDAADQGLAQRWYDGKQPFPLTIHVPFPWGSPLSGVADRADVAWYRRSIRVPADWTGSNVFLTIGASDWHTTVWLDGHLLGEHRGGYTPFSFDLTPHLKPGRDQRLVVRVDDKRRMFTLYGKQAYGNARGIWQTVYLEARGRHYLEALHLAPDIDSGRVTVTAYLPKPAARDLRLNLTIRGEGAPVTAQTNLRRGRSRVSVAVPLPQARRWTLDDPFLHTVEARLAGGGGVDDVVNSYFGMRKISVDRLPGTGFPYVALNDEPVYLQMALDQSYHPAGYYAFPSDSFMREEVRMAKEIGLNGIRPHVKVEIPRKLYWADRLGVLVMADLPNGWGPPDAEARREAETTLREMVGRDFNHPSVFAWVLFNETWGLTEPVGNGSNDNQYRPETQRWVADLYRQTKALDPTRLVEDNSLNANKRHGHVATDLISWHRYLPGYEWEPYLAALTAQTQPGSPFLFENGHRQGGQPLLNSEFGNVWGYQGTTGDVDFSWDYHRAVNAFRRVPQVAGWLYTQHHDVINEWNGYWRYDRGPKETGLGDLVEGMSLRDFHSPWYLSTGQTICQTVGPGQTVRLPLFASFLSGRTDLGPSLTLRTELYGWDALGQKRYFSSAQREVPYQPFFTGRLDSLAVVMPGERAVLVLAMVLTDPAGTVLHRNFVAFVVDAPVADRLILPDGKKARLARVPAAAFQRATWSGPQGSVLNGKKVFGTGAGFFEYELPWPAGLSVDSVEGAQFLVEASARPLLSKDRRTFISTQDDFLPFKGNTDPALNPNAYPMTDKNRHPSAVRVSVNGQPAGRYDLPDDPADHRGLLSWHAQPQDRRLYEAGTYGYRLSVPIPPEALRQGAETGALRIRLDVDGSMPGGLAVYGADFGRYPLDPTVLLIFKEEP